MTLSVAEIIHHPMTGFISSSVFLKSNKMSVELSDSPNQVSSRMSEIVMST
jgi:hypothetical protein